MRGTGEGKRQRVSDGGNSRELMGVREDEGGRGDGEGSSGKKKRKVIPGLLFFWIPDQK